MSIESFCLTYNKIRVIEMESTFGEKVRNLREDLDINQTQLGKELNMTQRKISYIECGKYEPSIEDISVICNFFKVSADYLIGIKKGYAYPER